MHHMHFVVLCPKTRKSHDATLIVAFVHRHTSFPSFATSNFTKNLNDVLLFASFSEPISGQQILKVMTLMKNISKMIVRFSRTKSKIPEITCRVSYNMNA